LLDRPEAAADRVVEALVVASLLVPAGTDLVGLPRYRLPDLIGDYARERAEADEPAADRRAAAERALRALLARVSSAPPAADPAGWRASERANLTAAVAVARRLGLADLAGDLAAAVTP
ncbi:MAG: hypothetical protein V7637_2331, partial [Mycobacteriales bacterium]